MNIVGIVTEHNPFHNGHRYHVEKARESCGADAVVSVMSGHFLQRGEPALFNKWARAEMAVREGVDIVIELPAAFSLRSANMFAFGAVSVLNAAGIVTHLCFGSESGDIGAFLPTARLLVDEPDEFKAKLTEYLAKGLSYPSARAEALSDYFKSTSGTKTFYSSPNNILGIEYIKSLLQLNSSMTPTTIKRFAAGYHDLEIESNLNIASATSIREEMLRAGGHLTDNVKPVVPESTFRIIEREIDKGRGPVFSENLLPILFYLLRTVPADYLSSICDVNEGLEHRILECSRKAASVKNLIELVKTKRYTWTRIQRVLSCLLLGYTSSMARSFDLTGPRYIRILGMSATGRKILKTLKKSSSLPVIIRTAPFLAKRDEIAEMLQFDLRATDIYTALYPHCRVGHQGLDCKIMPFVNTD